VPSVLLTGAAGHIGSHTWLALTEAGFSVIGVDDFSNSSPAVLGRLDAIFERHRIDAAMHFAAYKSVDESSREPLAYYANNLGGLVAVCEAMRRHGTGRIVFSSSATVYGQADELPVREDTKLAPTNPYGQTKLMPEQVLHDLGVASAGWQSACLRYFNPVGAHPRGQIGEQPQGRPNNLMACMWHRSPWAGADM